MSLVDTQLLVFLHRTHDTAHSLSARLLEISEFGQHEVLAVLLRCARLIVFPSTVLVQQIQRTIIKLVEGGCVGHKVEMIGFPVSSEIFAKRLSRKLHVDRTQLQLLLAVGWEQLRVVFGRILVADEKGESAELLLKARRGLKSGMRLLFG